MELAPAIQYVVFGLFAAIAIGGALGMTTTMSMFRSAIFLMASFLGVAGLFILLLADLLALLQVMMYVGGMLVMALFMVLFSGDPGGRMMTGMMKLPPLEKLFSLGLVGGRDDDAHAGHDEDGGDGGHGTHGDHGGGHHDMEPMFNLSLKKPAAVLGLVIGAVLSALVVLRPAWPVSGALPDQRSAERIGDLLMGKYMIAFEGAGLLILLGIFGAVYLARPDRYPDPADRERIQAAVDEPPPPIVDEALAPLHPLDLDGGDGDDDGEARS